MARPLTFIYERVILEQTMNKFLVCLAVYFRPLWLLIKRTFVLFLWLFWEPISRKRSHWWHWKPYQPNVNHRLCQWVAGNPKSKPRTSFWSNLWQTNFGWQWVAVLEPYDIQPFQIGFVEEDGRRRLCSKPVKNRRIGMLLGPDPIRFFAVNQKGEQIALRLVMIATKYRMPRKTQIY